MSCFQVLPSNIIVRPYKVVETEARGFFKQLLSGIACIHANGFCHRDVKPENCMVECATGTLKIIDFGGAPTSSATWCTGARHAIHHIVYRVLATSSST